MISLHCKLEKEDSEVNFGMLKGRFEKENQLQDFFFNLG